MTAHMWTLPDGEEQRQRDMMFKTRPMFSAGGWDGKHIDEVPATPKDPLFFAWMLAHDVVDFVGVVPNLHAIVEQTSSPD
jgi:salicylate hydroxylase